MMERNEELYKITENDVKKASKILAQAFHTDPAWVYVFPDKIERARKLPIVFESSLIYSLRYGEALASSSNLEGIAILLPSHHTGVSIWKIVRSRAIITGLKIGRKVSSKIYRVFNPLDKDRKNYMIKPYLYLQVIGVSPESQRKGFGSKLLEYICNKGKNKDMPIYLETEVEKNVEFYGKYGFEVIKKVTFPANGLTFWQMVKKPH